MGIDFVVILVADFNNVIRFYVRHPARQPRVTRRHAKILRKQQMSADLPAG